jgi:methylmalonyl-CoA mutase C-terminal domain/subunit
MTGRSLRVLLAKPGLDGHDRGLKVIARRLRDNGYEVIYLGRRQRPQAIARAAVEEDADVIGISVLSGTHMTVASEVIGAVRACGVDAPIVIGGTILRAEIPALLDAGIDAVFPVGTKLEEIDAYFRAIADRKAVTASP